MIIMDIGANWGTDSLDQTRDDPSVVCYAFEPTPELAKHLREKSADFADRYVVIQVAVSDFNGNATFNVASHGDWGVSSLLEFSEDRNKTWYGRRDLYNDREEIVDVIRMDDWLDQYPEIEQIDFLHCDAQGSDLAVLKGFGDKISMVRKGVVEVPSSEAVMLYRGQHTREEMVSFLEGNGFSIVEVLKQQNEENLVFERKQ